MKAVLLAAGIGKRLDPITKYIPKPMINICGKPIIEYIVNDIVKSGFNEICIVVGHESEQIKNYFNNYDEKIKISFVIQDEYKGTAHATYCAKDFVKNDPFLLYLSDTLIPFEINFLLNKMIKLEEISILSSENFANVSMSVGNILVEKNYVHQISEKSSTLKSKLAWAGVAFFNDSSIFNIIKNLSLSTRGEYDITEAMDVMLKNNIKIRNYFCKEFIDCGTLNGLTKGLKYILNFNKRKSSFSDSLTTVNPCYIGQNCSFGKNVLLGPYSSIENNVSIGDNVEIKNSIILDNSIISSNNVISNSIISKNAIISKDDNIL